MGDMTMDELKDKKFIVAGNHISALLMMQNQPEISFRHRGLA